MAIGTFSLGSVVGAILCTEIAYLSLLLPAAITLVSAFQYTVWSSDNSV